LTFVWVGLGKSFVFGYVLYGKGWFGEVYELNDGDWRRIYGWKLLNLVEL